MKTFIKTFIPGLAEFGGGFFLSFSFAGIGEVLFKETIHGVAVIITGIAGAIGIHLVRFYLQKKFPLKK